MKQKCNIVLCCSDCDNLELSRVPSTNFSFSVLILDKVIVVVSSGVCVDHHLNSLIVLFFFLCSFCWSLFLSLFRFFLEFLLHTQVSIINSYFYSTIVDFFNRFSFISTNFMFWKKRNDKTFVVVFCGGCRLAIHNGISSLWFRLVSQVNVVFKENVCVSLMLTDFYLCFYEYSLIIAFWN